MNYNGLENTKHIDKQWGKGLGLQPTTIYTIDESADYFPKFMDLSFRHFSLGDTFTSK